jgi:hypothetical protein
MQLLISVVTGIIIVFSAVSDAAEYQGAVLDSLNRPIPNARIRFVNSGQTSYSDKNGRFYSGTVSSVTAPRPDRSKADFPFAVSGHTLKLQNHMDTPRHTYPGSPSNHRF